MTTPRKIAHYGWIPDLPDQRDFRYAAPAAFLVALPHTTDLRSQCPGVYDQGQLGSCTANAIGGAIEFDRLKQKLPDFVPSRLFIYYNERVIEGTVKSDSGAQIRDGIKSVASQGVCPETEWPYDITKFTVAPPAQAYKDAVTDRAVSYQSLTQDINQMKGCLASGYPFVFGFTVYESFESPAVAQSGHASMPAPGERAIGGHAVMAVGYDDSNMWWVVRNSWGASWGLSGYFTLPYAYLTKPGLASDFWTIRVVGK
jgi:C1A family cysteine protease